MNCEHCAGNPMNGSEIYVRSFSCFEHRKTCANCGKFFRVGMIFINRKERNNGMRVLRRKSARFLSSRLRSLGYRGLLRGLERATGIKVMKI
jgi:hypothetical protein